MKSILIPTDFSPCAFKALAYAVELSAKANANLFLLHSINDKNIDQFEYTQIKAQVSDLLEEVIQKIDEKYNGVGGKITTVVSIGTIQEAISDAITQFKTDFIVMGTVGKSGNFSLGSNTVEVMMGIKIPILIIPEDAPSEINFNTIVLASDVNKFDHDDEIAPLNELALLFKSKVYLLHVRSKRDEYGLGQKEEREREIHLLDKKIQGGIKTEINDDPIEGIHDYVDNPENGTDLVCMLSRKHNLFEKVFMKSATRQMALTTHIPLLVIHE